MSKIFDLWSASTMLDGGFVRESAELAQALVDFLDELEDVDQDTAVDDAPCDDHELETSLGSFDHINQVLAWRMPENHLVGEDRELDDADDEPSLGSVGRCCGADQRSQEGWAAGGARDDREHDDSDDEPSLCGEIDRAGHGDQRNWACGSDRDLEGDSSDREPSLGWPERVDQRVGVISGQNDREIAAEPSAQLVAAASQKRAESRSNVRMLDGSMLNVAEVRR